MDQTILDKIAKVKDAIRSNMAKNHVVTVEFIKKDGTVRNMMLHRSKALESSTLAAHGISLPSVAKRKATNRANNNLSVEELIHVDGKPVHQWRTVPCERVTKITCNGSTTVF